MAIETSDLIVKEGTQLTLEANGAIVTDGSMVQANDDTYNRDTDGSDAPDAKLVLGFTVATAGTANSLIDVYIRRLNMDGANDAQIPTASYLQDYLGSFKYNNAVTTIQYAEFLAKDLPAVCDMYILNNVGQSISAGWTLKITPVTIGPLA